MELKTFISKTVLTNISPEVKNKFFKDFDKKIDKELESQMLKSTEDNMKKVILLTNDDGIEANGLKTLFCTFAEDNNFDVRIVAPDKEKSAVGHAITVFDPISVKKEFINGMFCGYSVDGTPADCVKLAITALLEKKPDLLISGINRGANIGENIIYSGTVSAATEGTIYDIPSIAVSVDSFKDVDYSLAAKFVKKIANFILYSSQYYKISLRGVNLPRKVLLNINFPAVSENEIKGVKVTHQSKVKFKDIFIKRVDPRGREYYWMDGDYEAVDDDDPDSDFTALRNNFISITPIHHDMTDYGKIELFKEIFSKNLF